MNILLTNDDGIDSEGLRTLARFLAPWATLWACAPKEQQSGSGQGITVRESIWVREEDMEGVVKAWSVAGKPADCVKIALLELLPEPVDIVISGINEGANLGTDTLYSGTVAGAMEGAIHHVPAIAISLAVPLALDGHGKGDWNYESAAGVCVDLFKRWKSGSLTIHPGNVLNVNVPDIPAEQMKGLKAVNLGIPQYSDHYDMLGEKNGSRRYNLVGERLAAQELDPRLDTVAVEEGFVTLTPLSVYHTDHALLEEITKQLSGKEGFFK
ncbi:MAG: 5'/3'-nucleotidase SurE [Peptococcaceae bacterium]|jgi:5'-nucleotidase|nr:5'/3'-nucleotidase SurE [Peptococcaceae bacterium]